MGRQKKVNEGMAGIKDLIATREARRDAIKAEHAQALEKALESDTVGILRAMFEGFPDAGDSEIANSIGKSRNTVYLWRKDYRLMVAEGRIVPAVKSAPVDAPASKLEHNVIAASFDYVGTPYLAFKRGDEQVFVFSYDGNEPQIGFGDTPEVAEDNELEARRAGQKNVRPEWLTDEIIKAESDRLGVKVAFAPWKK